jgi:hypothetical protein
MAAYPYRLPRRYRYRVRRKNDATVPIAAGVLLAIAVVATHPHGVTGTLHRASAGVRQPAPGAGVPVTPGSQTAFIAAVLADLGAPDTQADRYSLAAWFPHEGTAARFNPMASTMPEPGATIFNSIGVRNYVSARQGAQATAATLADGAYPLILAALRSGRGLCGDPSLAHEFLVWSGDGYSGVC